MTTALTFFMNFKKDGVVTCHMWQGHSPRCVGSNPQEATEDDFAQRRQDGSRVAWGAGNGPRGTVERGEKIYYRWTCRQCWWRYVDRRRHLAQG